MPRLVIVGGYGWKAAEVRARLAAGSRNGTLVWLENLSDVDLGVLYRNALFTVMPSHGEGWGLAVQESLALGVPCIASDAGATREAGLDLATYFDPSSSEGLTRAMAAWISDGAALAAARDRIARALATQTFPSWNDAGRGAAQVSFIMTCLA
jgi:glycosyltransferase involved in cell wall biosynthesis